MLISSVAFAREMARYYADKRTHSFAFWKLKALAEAGETYYQPEYDSYYSVYGNMLFANFSNNHSDNKVHLAAEALNRFDCIALEETMFDSIIRGISGFDINMSYKLHYDFSYEPVDRGPAQYTIQPFDFDDASHYETASLMINQGEGDWMMPDNIRKVTREPVFDRSLWFFAKEIDTGKLAGISISTYDRQMRETDIEWFYILPEYHRRGAGRFLIEETIRRSVHRSEDIRVGGTNEFYKKCGFVEKECSVWAAKNGSSLIAPCIQPNILP